MIQKFKAHHLVLFLISVGVVVGFFNNFYSPLSKADGWRFDENFYTTDYQDGTLTDSVIDWDVIEGQINLKDDVWSNIDDTNVGPTELTTGSEQRRSWRSAQINQSNGDFHIAWADLTNGEIHYQYWNGSSWNTLGGSSNITNDANAQDRVSLALDSSGNPHVAFMHFDGNWNIKHMYWNGSSWTTHSTGIVNEFAQFYQFPTLALDSSNNPYVVYQRSGSTGIKMRYWNGSAWSNLGGSETVASVGGTGYDGDIAIDSSGNPHVVWIGATSDYPHHRYWNGSSWANYSGNDYIVADASTFPRIELDSNDDAHVVWDTATNSFEYYYVSGGSWVDGTNNPGTGFGDVDIRIDNNDRVHVVSRDVGGAGLNYNYTDDKGATAWNHLVTKNFYDSGSSAVWPSFDVYDTDGSIWIQYMEGTFGTNDEDIFAIKYDASTNITSGEVGSDITSSDLSNSGQIRQVTLTSEATLNGGTINYYVDGTTSAGDCGTGTWTAATPGTPVSITADTTVNWCAVLTAANNTSNIIIKNVSLQFNDEIRTVTNPNGSEIYNVGENVAITWDYEGTDNNNVDIQYSTNGSSYTDIVTNTANDGYYLWDTTGLSGATTYTVRVYDTGANTIGVDTSDADFTLLDSGTVTSYPFTTAGNYTIGDASDVQVSGGHAEFIANAPGTSTQNTTLDFDKADAGDFLVYDDSSIDFNNTGVARLGNTYDKNTFNQGYFFASSVSTDQVHCYSYSRSTQTYSACGGSFPISLTISSDNGDIAVGPEGDLWVTADSGVYRYDASSSYALYSGDNFTSGILDNTDGNNKRIAFDADGNLFVADTGSQHIHRFTVSDDYGLAQSMFINGGVPRDVVIDQQGDVFTVVSDEDIYCYDASNSYAACTYGDFGTGASGRIDTPWTDVTDNSTINVDVNGNLWVNEPGVDDEVACFEAENSYSACNSSPYFGGLTNFTPGPVYGYQNGYVWISDATATAEGKCLNINNIFSSCDDFGDFTLQISEGLVPDFLGNMWAFDSTGSDLVRVDRSNIASTLDNLSAVDIEKGTTGEQIAIIGSEHPTGSHHVFTTSDINQYDTTNVNQIDAIIPTEATLAWSGVANTEIRYLFSFDDRVTWKYHNGASWVAATGGDLPTQMNNNGMLGSAFSGQGPTFWGASGGFSAGSTNTVDIAFGLKTDNQRFSPHVDSINFTFIPKYPIATNPDNNNVVNNTGLSYDTITAFSANMGASNTGQVKFQLSDDDGTTWYYWNGSAWASSTNIEESSSSTEEQINTNLDTFPDNVSGQTSGTLKWRMLLINNGGNENMEFTQVDSVSVTSSLVLANSIDIKSDNTYATSASTLTLDSGDQTIYVEFQSTALSGTGPLTGTVTNDTRTDSESVTLTETGTGTAIFRGTLPTAKSSTPTSSNGTVEGLNGDTVSASYEVSGSEVIIQDFEGFADTAAMKTGTNWFDYVPGVSGTEPTEAILTSNDGTNTTQFYQKQIDAIGAATASTTTTAVIPDNTTPITITVGSTAGFNDPPELVRLDDGTNHEIVRCSGSNTATTLTSCSRPGDDLQESYAIGTNVYDYEDNPYGVSTILSASVTTGTAWDFTDAGLSFDIYVDNVANLDSTGSNYSWIGNQSTAVPTGILYQDGTNNPYAIFTVPSNGWNTITIPVDSFPTPLTTSAVTSFIIFVASGDGSYQGGNDMLVKFDNWKITNKVYSDSVTASAVQDLSTTIKDSGCTSEAATISAGSFCVEVLDPSVDTTGSPDTLDVTVSSSSGDSESLTLTETGNNTGLFQGTITAADDSVTADDGTLQASDSDTINAYYGLTFDFTEATTSYSSSTSYASALASENQCLGLDSSPCTWLYGEQLLEAGGTPGLEQTSPYEANAINQPGFYSGIASNDGTFGNLVFTFSSNDVAGIGYSFLLTEQVTTASNTEAFSFHYHGQTATSTDSKIYVWNDNSSIWEQIGSMAANTTSTTEVTVTKSGLSNYIESGTNRIHLAITSDTPNLGDTRPDFIEFKAGVNATENSLLNDTATFSGAAACPEDSVCPDVTVSNIAPAFTVNTTDSSDNTSPTNNGDTVSFAATASDQNGDQYYLLVCADGNTASPGNDAAPSCSGTQICVSSATSSGAAANCTSAAIATASESVDWESFVCDKVSGGGLCSSTEVTNSPYAVNHRPSLASVTADDASGSGSTIEPGDTVYVSATITDSDTGGSQDTVTLVVCDDGNTFNSSSPGDGVSTTGCSGGTIGAGGELCRSSTAVPGSHECSFDASITSIPTAHGNYDYELFSYDNHSFAEDGTAQNQQYAVTDVAPVVDTVVVHGSNDPFPGAPSAGETPSGSPVDPLVLTPASTTTTYVAALVHDNNGDGDFASTITSRFFDTNASQTSSCEPSTGSNSNAQQECYEDTNSGSCELRGISATGSGKTATGTEETAYVYCSYPVYFNANASTGWDNFVEVADGSTTVSGTTSGADYEIGSLPALEVRTAADAAYSGGIAFGSLTPGQSNTDLDQIVYIANVGNNAFQTQVSSSDLCRDWQGQEYGTCPTDEIDKGLQKFSSVITRLSADVTGNPSSFGVTSTAGFGTSGTIVISDGTNSETKDYNDVSGSTVTLTSALANNYLAADTYINLIDSYGSGVSIDGNECITTTVPVRTINTEKSFSRAISFGIKLPTGLPTGTYTGQNTFTAGCQ